MITLFATGASSLQEMFNNKAKIKRKGIEFIFSMSGGYFYEVLFEESSNK